MLSWTLWTLSLDTLSFQSHIEPITKSAFYHLRIVPRLRPLPRLRTQTPPDSQTAWLRPSSTLPSGLRLLASSPEIPSKTPDKLQRVQTSSCQGFHRTKRPGLIPTPYQPSLAPIQVPHLFYKILLTYKSFHALAPQYLW